jgi:hypothetical protein
MDGATDRARGRIARLRAFAMTIHYALKRKDIWDAYWFTWRNGWKLKVAQLFITGCAFFVTKQWLSGGGPATTSQLAISFGVALLSILWLPLYPLVLYKPHQRMLTIGPEGVVTSIGDRSGEVPWIAIDRVQLDGDRLYVVGKSGNSFAIPGAAFPSHEERKRFADQCLSYWQNRRG